MECVVFAVAVCFRPGSHESFWFVLSCVFPFIRFFISIKDDAGWADNRYVAFGRVAEGMDVVHQIERVKVEGGTNKPKKPVVVDKCGLL